MKRIYIVFLVLLTAATTMAAIALFSQPKIGVVDFKRLVNEFQGMKDATREYEKKMKGWNATNDSLTNEIKAELSDYYADSAFLSTAERVNREQKILILRNKYVEFTQGLEANAQNEDQEMTVAVVNQVLAFVEKFGNENGYDVILGKNEGDDVLFKKVELDITDEVLSELNKSYEGF